MQQVLIGIILILGLGGFWLYNENVTLKENNIKLEAAVEEQKKTMAAMKESYEKQGKQLGELSAKNMQYESQMNEYLDIFRRHNLSQLASAKPGMVETSVNNATKEVFDGIEEDSKTISLLNTPNNIPD